MFLNLTHLRDELANRVKHADFSTTRKDYFINGSQDDIALDIDCDHLQQTETFTSVSGTAAYNLQYDFNKILSVVDTSNDIDLIVVTKAELEEVDPALDDSGTPYYFSIDGISWVYTQPSSASAITVVSSSASDTSQKVRLSGLVNSIEDTELLSLNGTTEVTGTKSFSRLDQVAKDETTTGNITVKAGATTLVTIPSFKLAKQYQTITLWTKPSSALNYIVRGYRRPRPMVNIQDYPDYPEMFHELVLFGALIRANLDLFRLTVAKEIKLRYYDPMKETLQKQMSNKRGKRSVILSPFTPMRSNYPPEYGVRVF